MTTMRGMRQVDLAGAPAIPGLRSRFFADTSDYEALAALFGAANQADQVPWFPTARNVELEMSGGDGADPVNDIVLVEVDGRLVAGTGLERTLRDVGPTYDIWGAVDPAYPPSRPGDRAPAAGLWTTRVSGRRARIRARRSTCGAFSEDTETGHRALLDGAGFETVRHFFLMLRAGLDDVPDAPLPEGLEIRPVAEDQWRTIFDAENEAFRDHWGHREMTDSDFRRTYDAAELDTDLWVVAWDGDQVAGVVQTWVWPEENERLGVKRGWLEHISVRRPWRRRGLARAITAASLVRLREHGLAEAMLGVDSENPNGALGLYEGLGFGVYSRATAYERVLDR